MNTVFNIFFVCHFYVCFINKIELYNKICTNLGIFYGTHEYISVMKLLKFEIMWLRVFTIQNSIILEVLKKTRNS